ncbi:transketolase [Candidatus Woesearchaeota archaeon]|nr:transketolase [Candidatus Woesearchaeota archaeon]|tara:strand:+ start:5319 stop:6299 length:981 start_codon:yes stop_codon:yes gene_type:complete
MINPEAKLSKKLLTKEVDMVPTRNGYGEGLVEAGEKDKRIVALCADLTESTRTQAFAEEFPKRFIEVGVAEQLLITVAAGMANYGKIPFITSYAAFSPGRNWEQIRTTAALNDVPVKIGGMHAGISVGPDGATHQALEDMATMRSIPNMIVIAPTDSIESKKATIAATKHKGPVYMRFGREKVPVVTTKKTPFKIGKAEVFRDGKDVAVIACGSLVYEALMAAEQLKGQVDVMVVNNHTIKPIDVETITAAAKKTGAVVTAEEHQINGGMGSAVMEVLGEHMPVPVKRVGIKDLFGQSGEPDELMDLYGLKSKDIIAAIKEVVKRK